MILSKELLERSGNQCECCGLKDGLETYTVPPKSGNQIDHQVVVCPKCLTQIESSELPDANHWQCLHESMWSVVPSVQVVSYRMLQRLSSEKWAQDLLDMMDLEPDIKEWADDSGGLVEAVHKDSNGNILQQGDTVVLIQDLNVKGANFTAKRGTSVKRITLVNENPEQIEGKINDQNIVILTKYVKKSV